MQLHKLLLQTWHVLMLQRRSKSIRDETKRKAEQTLDDPNNATLLPATPESRNILQRQGRQTDKENRFQRRKLRQTVGEQRLQNKSTKGPFCFTPEQGLIFSLFTGITRRTLSAAQTLSARCPGGAAVESKCCGERWQNVQLSCTPSWSVDVR